MSKKIVVEIEWDKPDEPFWLNPDNVAVALHAYCKNTRFIVTSAQQYLAGAGAAAAQSEESGADYPSEEKYQMMLVAFGKWSHAAGRRLIWDRVYWRGYRWTPFCVVRRRYL